MPDVAGSMSVSFLPAVVSEDSMCCAAAFEATRNSKRTVIPFVIVLWGNIFYPEKAVE